MTTFHPKHFLESDLHPDFAGAKKCVICEKWISTRPNHLYCRPCNLCFHKECSTSLMENLTIDRPATHEHTLTFIRQKNSFNCVACGMVVANKEMNFYGMYEINMYGCLPCNFFIHRDCMFLPKVIKLTRHSHRLFHTYQVPDHNTKCRICYDPFVCGSGGYICSDKTCDYKLHSQCATRNEIWDGKDVEREPEEISNSEDVTMKFSSLEEVDGKTLQCDFALHDTCARLPRKMEHLFHRHSLTLEVDMMNIKEGFFRCSKCERESYLLQVQLFSLSSM
ncbi:BnaA05g36940D [Brassica napus]|uniref:BnaA05g36940D protein n=1 Tax=Brassica napus TaxID=3708 RepID=A0A078J528_BRANA|nr:BnaA05g36940D [Brassica napus]